ncbi:MAG: DUF2088 domain-containing protein [Dehalococcoidales bacterium]|nr:DUF2088 domain-containing protein [Dehalococcoidales bacterium]
MTNIVHLPQYAWFEEQDVAFTFPDDWLITEHRISGHDVPGITAGEIETAIKSPLGMPPLRELARTRNEAVIIFDDMTRNTKVYEVIPYILEELTEAGFTGDRIRFVAALGNHQALDRSYLVKKLGEDIVAGYPVYNHCPFLNCTDIGTSSFGTKVAVNSEVMHCDLKIAIGQVVPHGIVGLSGGGKIIMPGVSSYESVRSHHTVTHREWSMKKREGGPHPYDEFDDNPLRADALEIAGMAGLDMVINTVINSRGETVKVFAGALEPAYATAYEYAKSHYAVVNPRDADIAVCNNYIKASEFMVAMSPGMQSLKPEGGSVVLISSSPSGQVIHYMYDNFGKFITGDAFFGIEIAPHIKNFIMYNEYPEAKIPYRFKNPEQVIQTNDWNKVISILQKDHGPGSRVAVFPNADTQYFVRE